MQWTCTYHCAYWWQYCVRTCTFPVVYRLKLLIHVDPSHHYNDVIMSAMASQITSLTIVYSTNYSGQDQRKHQSSTSLAFVRWIHRWPVNSPHKGPVTRKIFPFDDVIMGTVCPRIIYTVYTLWCCVLLWFGASWFTHIFGCWFIGIRAMAYT